MSENNKKYLRASASAELTKRIFWINGRLVKDYNLLPEVRSSYIKEITLLGRESSELHNKMRSEVKLSGNYLILRFNYPYIKSEILYSLSKVYSIIRKLRSFKFF